MGIGLALLRNVIMDCIIRLREGMKFIVATTEYLMIGNVRYMSSDGEYKMN